MMISANHTRACPQGPDGPELTNVHASSKYQRNHSFNLHPYQDKQWLSCYTRILVLIDTVMALTAGAGGELNTDSDGCTA